MHLCQKLQRLFNHHKFLLLSVLLINGAGVNLTTNLKVKQKTMNSLGLLPPSFFEQMLYLTSSLVVFN